MTFDTTSSNLGTRSTNTWAGSLDHRRSLWKDGFLKRVFFWGAQWYWQFWHGLVKYWNTWPFFKHMSHVHVWYIFIFIQRDWLNDLTIWCTHIFLVMYTYRTTSPPKRGVRRTKVQQSVLVRRRPALTTMETLWAKESIPGWWFQIYVFYNHYQGKWSNLTNIFQMGWNHQLDTHVWYIKFGIIFFM